MSEKDIKELLGGIGLVVSILKIVIQHRGQCMKEKRNKKA